MGMGGVIWGKRAGVQGPAVTTFAESFAELFSRQDIVDAVQKHHDWGWGV